MTVEEQRTMQAVQKIAQKINDFSLRDYFVGQALSGMGEYLMKNRDEVNKLAESCYKIADALLEQRTK